MNSLIKFSLIFLLTQGCFSSDVEYKSYENYKIYEIKNGDTSHNFLSHMKTLDRSLLHTNTGETTQVLIAPELMPAVEYLLPIYQLKGQRIIDDYSRVIARDKTIDSHNTGFSWTAYYDVDDIYGYLRNMSNLYSKWTKLIVGGKTYEGRQIMGLRINTPTGSSSKPVMFIESGIHAREWIAPATTTYFINQLLTSSNPDIVAMRDNFDWHIFPTCNPDGYHYSFTIDRMWRKTRSKSPNGCYGTDPNRNWDYNWMKHGASDDPCDEVYGGPRVFSEVETRTLSEYIASLKNITAYIAYHSDAQMLLVPYSDSPKHTGNYDDLIKIGTTSLDYGYKVNHDQYAGPGTADEILYPVSGGSMDWVRHVYKTPLVFTYELRGNMFTWPPKKIPEQGDEVTQMLLGLIKEAKKLGYF